MTSTTDNLSPGLWLIQKSKNSSSCTKIAEKDTTLQNLQIPLHLSEDLSDFVYHYMKNKIFTSFSAHPKGYIYSCPSSREFSLDLLNFVNKSEKERETEIKRLKSKDLKRDKNGFILDSNGNKLSYFSSMEEIQTAKKELEVRLQELNYLKELKETSLNIDL